MTLPHTGPPLEASDLGAAIAALRARGLRVSASRRLVLEALFAADEPLSAEAIAEGAGGRLPRSDPASVYRNLETLEEVGLVRHFHAGHGPGLYVRADDAREYLRCDSCGGLTGVEPEQLDGARAAIRRDFGFEARFTHLPVAGLCASCAQPRGRR